MSTALAIPVKHANESTRSASSALPAAVEFHYTQTDSFVALLQELGASLLVTTYQANKLLAVRATDNGLSTLVRTFDRPMGLAVGAGRLALGCREQVWEFRNAPHWSSPLGSTTPVSSRARLMLPGTFACMNLHGQATSCG